MAKTTGNPGGRPASRPGPGLVGSPADKITTAKRDMGYQSVQEGTETGVWGGNKGASYPGFDEYPPEYKKLVGGWNNGADSVNKPMGPVDNFSTGDYSTATKGGTAAAAKSYPIGGKQPRVKEGP